MMPTDVPSPIDLCQIDDAMEWERTALAKRPYRPDFFAAFAAELRQLNKPSLNVLELGSGPGFLAAHLLSAIPDIALTLLDFSEVMHDLAKRRLGTATNVNFVIRDFRAAGWTHNLSRYDAVITNQAVHELRHKRHAQVFHAQVKSLLAADRVYLVCDHFCGEGGMLNNELYMTADEQQQCLEMAGYNTHRILTKGSLVLHRAM